MNYFDITCAFGNPYTHAFKADDLIEPLKVLDKSLLDQSRVDTNLKESLGWQVIYQVLAIMMLNVTLLYRILPLVQSSGFGKTKSAFDLMQVHRLVYFPCDAALRSTNKPPVFAKIMNIFAEVCKSEENPDKFARTIITAIFNAAKKFPTPDDLRDAQLGHEGKFYSALVYEMNRAVSLSKKVHFKIDEENQNQDSGVLQVKV